MKNSEENNGLVVSYLTLRQLIGYLGLGLPLVILFNTFVLSPCSVLEHSISVCYHTTMRDILVGILCATGVFMITYKGYDRRDTIGSTIAGICSIGVAMFPTNEVVICGTNTPVATWITDLHLHYASAAGLFVTFAYMSLRLFTLSGGEMTPKKLIRNRIYQTCGWVIVACIVILVARMFIDGLWPDKYRPVFWLEMVSLLAFGTSWLVKGEAILKDQPEVGLAMATL